MTGGSRRASRLRCFNPQPPRKVAAMSRRRSEGAGSGRGFNPQPPRKVAAIQDRGRDHGCGVPVSILSHPERWLLSPEVGGEPEARGEVSILSHPERWLLSQRPRRRRTTRSQRFNPQPPRKVAAMRGRLRGVSILSHPERWLLSGPRGSFNPQPPRKVAAIGEATRRRVGFNPQPPRKVAAIVRGESAARRVSILSHPERWLLSGGGHMWSAGGVFQSSATPKGGCYREHWPSVRCRSCFNPQPPRKVAAGAGSLVLGFQSSATPKGGCYGPGSRRIADLFRPAPPERTEKRAGRGGLGKKAGQRARTSPPSRVCLGFAHYKISGSSKSV